MVTHLSKDDPILCDGHGTEENRRGTMRTLPREILTSNSNGGKEASKKKSALKRQVLRALWMASLIHLPMSLSIQTVARSWSP